MNVGIVGFGFVGKAAYNGFARKIKVPHFKLHVYDKYVPWESIVDWTCRQGIKDPVLHENITGLYKCDFIFVCLPTPTDFEAGKQDTSLVEDAVNDICAFCRQGADRPEIVIKSTVRPGTTKKLQEKNADFKILFNPEFLVEKTFLIDFMEQDRIVLGGKYRDNLEAFYRLGWPDAEYHQFEDPTGAELVKYGANAFLSTKVSFFNELFYLASALEIGYNGVADAICSDKRIGHWGRRVPGPDGQHGFGGKCFPKDLITLLDLGNELCVPNYVQRATWLTNEAVREKKYWLEIEGASTEKLHGQEDLDE